MDLVWLVYGISLLSGFGGMLTGAVIVSTCAMIFLLIYRGAECTEQDYYNEQRNAKRAANGKWAMNHAKTAFVVFLTCTTLLTFLPSEKTAYMMVGAYATQKIAEDEKVQETGSKVLKLINQKLDSYVDEGITEAEKAVKGKK